MCDSIVWYWVGYGLVDLGFKFWQGQEIFSVQTGSGVYACQFQWVRGFFPLGRATGVWYLPLISIKCQGQKLVKLLSQQFSNMLWIPVQCTIPSVITFNMFIKQHILLRANTAAMLSVTKYLYRALIHNRKLFTGHNSGPCIKGACTS